MGVLAICQHAQVRGPAQRRCQKHEITLGPEHCPLQPWPATPGSWLCPVRHRRLREESLAPGSQGKHLAAAERPPALPGPSVPLPETLPPPSEAPLQSPREGRKLISPAA